jgi:hypothetical protein
MTQELAKREERTQELSLIEQVVMQGDLSKLNPEQRVVYYRKVCESAGLNPFTRPFDYISLNGKLTLYAKKDCTEQLRKLNGISIVKLESQIIDELYVVKATASTRDGRTDEATGAVTIGNLKGEQKANAIMKAETKAKRRVTLSISGMGWTDESEIESIPNAKAININMATGEIDGDFNDAKMQPLTIEKPKISDQQALELKMIIEECDPEYQDWFYKRLRSTTNGIDIRNFPHDLYEKMKVAATKNMNANHEKQKAEFEKQSELQLEAVE